MNTTIPNLDDQAYRALRARAIVEGRTVADLMSDAIRGYLLRGGANQKRGSLRALKPEPFPEGNEHLSSEIDSFVYGQW